MHNSLYVKFFCLKAKIRVGILSCTILKESICIMIMGIFMYANGILISVMTFGHGPLGTISA